MLGWGRGWGEPRSGCGGGLVVCEAVLGPEVKEQNVVFKASALTTVVFDDVPERVET